MKRNGSCQNMSTLEALVKFMDRVRSMTLLHVSANVLGTGY